MIAEYEAALVCADNLAGQDAEALLDALKEPMTAEECVARLYALRRVLPEGAGDAKAAVERAKAAFEHAKARAESALKGNAMALDAIHRLEVCAEEKEAFASAVEAGEKTRLPKATVRDTPATTRAALQASGAVLLPHVPATDDGRRAPVAEAPPRESHDVEAAMTATSASLFGQAVRVADWARDIGPYLAALHRAALSACRAVAGPATAAVVVSVGGKQGNNNVGLLVRAVSEAAMQGSAGDAARLPNGGIQLQGLDQGAVLKTLYMDMEFERWPVYNALLQTCGEIVILATPKTHTMSTWRVDLARVLRRGLLATVEPVSAVSVSWEASGAVLHPEFSSLTARFQAIAIEQVHRVMGGGTGAYISERTMAPRVNRAYTTNPDDVKGIVSKGGADFAECETSTLLLLPNEVAKMVDDGDESQSVAVRSLLERCKPKKSRSTNRRGGGDGRRREERVQIQNHGAQFIASHLCKDPTTASSFLLLRPTVLRNRDSFERGKWVPVTVTAAADTVSPKAPAVAVPAVSVADITRADELRALGTAWAQAPELLHDVNALIIDKDSTQKWQGTKKTAKHAAAANHGPAVGRKTALPRKKQRPKKGYFSVSMHVEMTLATLSETK